MSDSPQSPPKDVEQGVQSPDDEAQMNDTQDPHGSGLAYEFEVKEQDRWLPIANGKSPPFPPRPLICAFPPSGWPIPPAFRSPVALIGIACEDPSGAIGPWEP